MSAPSRVWVSRWSTLGHIADPGAAGYALCGAVAGNPAREAVCFTSPQPGWAWRTDPPSEPCSALVDCERCTALHADPAAPFAVPDWCGSTITPRAYHMIRAGTDAAPPLSSAARGQLRRIFGTAATP